MGSTELAADLANARFLLRQSQRRWAAGVIADPSAASPLELADQRAAQRVVGATVEATSGEPRSDASTSSLKGSRAAVICLSAGMVYLM